jgi:beta-lactamase regulating signal transducer with metallopeptidase domain
VKLVLPTSLTLPTSVGYWVGMDKTVQSTLTTVVANENAISPTVSPTVNSQTDSPAMTQTDLQSPQPAAEPKTVPQGISLSQQPQPTVSLDWRAMIFLAWAAIAIGMALLVIQRYLFVRGLVRQASDADGMLLKVFSECCLQMKISRTPTIKVSPAMVSPAACLLARPVILVPEFLPTKLSEKELRAVLLHELAHIRRGDLWLNCAQTILQVIYFYNPLLWLANGVIRRIREQAVDETVLVTLSDNAGDYPETLLNVAKLALARPALSLRLVGVVESKSALAGRIKHMLSHPWPKSAKLGGLALTAIVVLAALLLPMAKGEQKSSTETETPEKVVGEAYPAAEKTSTSQRSGIFKATFSNGVTAEVVGISDYPSKGKEWWRADGSKLTEILWDEVGIDNRNIPRHKNGKLRTVIIRENTLGMKDTKLVSSFVLTGGGGVGGGINPHDADGNIITDLIAWGISIPETQNTVGIRFGMATGEWKTLVEYKGQGTSGYSLDNGKSISFAEPYENEDKVVLTISTTNIEGVDIRLIAIDDKGNIHTADRNSGVGTQNSTMTTYQFPDLHKSQIKEYQFQTRPYEWIEIKNIPLEPGIKTNVEIVSDKGEKKMVGEAQPTTSTVKSRMVNDDSKVRADIEAVLEHFWAAVERKDLDEMLKNVNVYTMGPQLETIYNQGKHEAEEARRLGWDVTKFSRLVIDGDIAFTEEKVPEKKLSLVYVLEKRPKVGKWDLLGYTNLKASDSLETYPSKFKKWREDMQKERGLNGMPAIGMASSPQGITYRQLHFVRVVFGKKQTTFEGQFVDPAVALVNYFANVNDRANTVLEYAVDNDNLTLKEFQKIEKKVFDTAKGCGNNFAYLSYVGVHPLGSKGSPTKYIAVGQFAFDKEIPVQLSYNMGMGPGIMDRDSGRLFIKDIRFIKGQDHIAAEASIWVSSWPKADWEIQLRLLDKSNKSLYEEWTHITTTGWNTPEPYVQNLKGIFYKLPNDTISSAATFEISITRRNTDDSAAGKVVDKQEKMVGSAQPTTVPVSAVNDEIKVYQVNKNVSQFPIAEAFSTPESAYAAINRVSATGDPAGWERVSVKELADKLAAEKKRGKMDVLAEWAKVLRNAEILEVCIWNNEAVVMAKFLQQYSSQEIRRPIDVRHLRLENGRWLNVGNDRVDTVEEGELTFKRRINDLAKKTVSATQPTVAAGQANSVVTVKVVNEDGQPVEGAVVNPFGLRVKEDMVAAIPNMDPVISKTNREGLAEVTYPKYDGKEGTVGALSLQVKHPDYQVAISQTYLVDGTAPSIVMIRGATVKLQGYLGEDKHVVAPIYPLMSEARNEELPLEAWNRQADGWLITHQMPLGSHYIQIVYFDKGRSYFSEREFVAFEKGKTYEYSLELKPGLHLAGQLDSSIPRPVKNGRVMVLVRPENQKYDENGHEAIGGILMWEDWREVQSDGHFVFESLPPGNVELIALCEGYISKKAPELMADNNTPPQLFMLEKSRDDLNIPMVKTAVCRVKVQDEQGRPISGVRVAMFPNVDQYHVDPSKEPWGQFRRMLGSRVSTAERFFRGTLTNEQRKKMFENIPKYEATTNVQGFAQISELPEGRESLMVAHDDYTLIAKPTTQPDRWFDRNDWGVVELKPGKTVDVEVVMRKKVEKNTAGDVQTASTVDGWGLPLSGVQLRLRAKKIKWDWNETPLIPILWADMRNNGDLKLMVMEIFTSFELEMDGIWYKNTQTFNIFPTGFGSKAKLENIRIPIDPGWAKLTDQTRLQVTPGTHIFRIAWIGLKSGIPPYRIISNPVKIEILQNATTQANTKTDAMYPNNSTQPAPQPDKLITDQSNQKVGSAHSTTSEKKSVLSFRIAADLPKADKEKYISQLMTEGPMAGRGRQDGYQWFETSLNDYGRIIQEYQGKKYMLLSNQPGEVMLPGDWGLKNVSPTKDAGNKPAIVVEFDDAGANHFAKITKANIDKSLAIVVNDKVVSAPVVRSPMSRRGIITGKFTQKEVDEMVKTLKDSVVSSTPPTMTPPITKVESGIYLVQFCEKNGFTLRNNRELLEAFNDLYSEGNVRTHHYSAKMLGGKLVGSIYVDGDDGKEAIKAILDKSEKLSLMAIKPVMVSELTTFLVSFKSAQPLKTGTAKELLDTFNAESLPGISTTYFRTEIQDNNLIGYILAESKDGKEFLKTKLTKNKKITVIEISPADLQTTKKIQNMKQVSLSPSQVKNLNSFSPSTKQANDSGMGENKKAVAGMTQEAVHAAMAWLKNVDKKQYDISWSQSADYFRQAVSREQWGESMKSVREPLGKLVSRKIISKEYKTSLPGAPDGEYVVIQFQTSFENKKEAVETVTPMKDKDGVWRVSGYYIK